MQTSSQSQNRLLSLLELAVGSFVVLGHNVWHILPNEVPILFLVGWISLRWRNGGWKAAGLRRPESWWKIFALACAAAAVLQLGGDLLVAPLTSRIWPAPENVSTLLQSVAGDWKEALVALFIVWTFAAFGEELSYRGYLLTRAADRGRRSNPAFLVAMLFVALLFGFAHYYKGPAGVVDSVFSGLVLGGIYLLSSRHLWAPILAHGISDTYAVVIVFLGWAS